MAADEFITLSELALLGAFLGGPVYLLAAVAQGVFLTRRGLSWSERRLRLSLAVVGTALLTYLLTFAVWVGVPFDLLDWPGTGGDWPLMFLKAVFVPALLAAAMIYPPATWGLLRAWGAAQQRDEADEARDD